DGIERVEKIAAEIKSRFNIAVDAADGSSDARKTKLVEASEVILACAKAGVQVVSKAQLKGDGLLIAADVNAVPP
ncbi:MAG: methylenetetrahydromethanopterin dehydrogenase, partial [Mesorhizobium sp.]